MDFFLFLMVFTTSKILLEAKLGEKQIQGLILFLHALIKQNV